MSILCPKCEKSNSCNCKTCNSDGLNKNLIIVLKDEGLYQCSFCGYKFCEGEATDFEWDRMVSRWAKVATSELCLMWIENKKRIREELNIDKYEGTINTTEKGVVKWITFEDLKQGSFSEYNTQLEEHLKLMNIIY